jgi:zinc D-Ala-D-Ala carboxypeptidase
MNLSPHVTRAEFEHSPTAVKHGISNVMSLEQIERAKLVCVNCFEPIRAYLKKPIKVNSGFRSLVLNKKIGGSKTSQHCKGEALDLDLHDRKLFNWIIDNVDFDQLIYEFGTDTEANWFHISYSKGKNRKQVLRAVKRAGKTVYIPYSK